MKKYLLPLFLGTLALHVAVAQPGANRMERGRPDDFSYPYRADLPALRTFELDFAGGTPRELVKAIEKATDKSLNVVIPDEGANLKIPAISVKGVNVAQLFTILERASARTGHYWFRNLDSNSGYIDLTNSYGFRTEGPPTDNSIWFFYWNNTTTPQEVIAPIVCQFYQLGPYLDAGYTVEDITTTIRTGWTMLGETKPSELSYHKDTRVLVAVGLKHRVEMIGEALKQLPTDKPRSGQKETAAPK